MIFQINHQAVQTKIPSKHCSVLFHRTVLLNMTEHPSNNVSFYRLYITANPDYENSHKVRIGIKYDLLQTQAQL